MVCLCVKCFVICTILIIYWYIKSSIVLRIYTIFHLGRLELFKKSGIQLLLTAFWRPICFSRGWTAVSLNSTPYYFHFHKYDINSKSKIVNGTFIHIFFTFHLIWAHLTCKQILKYTVARRFSGMPVYIVFKNIFL